MLEIINLRKRYKEQWALDGVNLTLNKGEVVVIMGPSGCGKSTLIRCINRLILPDDGDIRLFGQSILTMSDNQLLQVRRKIGFVFQHFNLIERLKVWENVVFGLVMAGNPKDKCKSQALEALDLVGLKDLAERNVSQLSGGQMQRVGIARAIVTQPDLLLWDEPTASLDPIRVQEVLEAMESLLQLSSASMLIITHEIPFAMRVADRLILMENGRIVEEGAPAQVLSTPKSKVGQEYAHLAAHRYTLQSA